MERARKRTKTDTDEKGHILAPDDEVGLLKVQNATLAGEVRSLKEYAREVELKLRAYQSAADHGQLVASKYEQCWRELEASLSDLLLRSGQTDLAKVANANNEQLMSAVADFVDTVCEKKQDYLRALVGKIKREAGDEESGEETVEAGSPFTVALDSILAGMRERQKETARLVETLLTVTSTGTSAGPGADAIVRVAQGKLAAENALSACKEAISNVSRTNDRLKLELDDCRDEAAQLRRSLHVARTRGGVSIKKEHPANEQANASAAPAASKQAAPDPSTLVTKEEELSLILEKTRNELACSEEARGKLEAEIIRLNGTYLSPGFILQSEIVTNLKRENESLLRQHTNLVDSYNDMRRQLEDLQVQHAATLMKKDNIELLREQLTHSKSQMAAAESLMEKERQDNREAQTTLQTRISTMERQHGTAEALRKMVSSLEAENGRLKGEVDKLKVDRADLELQFNVRGERLTRLEAEVAMATVMSTGAAALRQERDIALERVGELEVFVQVLREANPQPLDLIEAAGQVRRLRGEVDTLRAGTETADAREKLAKALQEVDASRDMVSAKEKERAAAHAEATQLKSLLDEKEGALRAKDQEFNSICSEIDTIGGLYERQKEQNMGLLHQLAERDEQNTQLLSERIRFQQEKMGQSEDMRLFETKLNQMKEQADAQQKRGDVLEEQVKDSLDQLKAKLAEVHASRTESQQTAQALDLERRAHQATRDHASVLAKQLGGLSRRNEEQTAEIKLERQKRQTSEEKLAVAERKLKKMQGSGGGDVASDEAVDFYVNILQCPMMAPKWKEVSLPCGHMLSKAGVDKLNKNRNRKCPICMKSFSVSDTRNIYFGVAGLDND